MHIRCTTHNALFQHFNVSISFMPNNEALCVPVSDLVFGHHVGSVDQRRSDGRFVLQRLAQ